MFKKYIYVFWVSLFFASFLNAQLHPDKVFNTIEGLKGVNYYPQDSPWDTFGEAFNEEVLKEDFKLIRSMGLNTIRIFVQYQDFGDTNPSSEKIERLCTLMAIASAQGISVMVTLFDFYGEYDLKKSNENKTHLSVVVNSLKDHSNLLAWDIKNEPDLDFKSQGKDKVLKWLKLTLQELRALDDRHLITIGWSNPESARHLVEEVDFVSFHYYMDIPNLEKDFKTLSSNTNKPVVLQEYGFSSYSGFSNLFSSSQKKQAFYYKKAKKIIEENSIPNLFWTLYDFEKIPKLVVGDKPRHQKKQMRFGVIDLNKKKKRAYHFLIQNEDPPYVSLKK